MSFILLLQNTFYLWGPGLLNYSNSGTNNDRSAVSRLYQSPGKVHGSDLNLAKVSLDFDLLALQIEDTVEVIDMKSNEAWSIKIKSGHDNCILENGIIWSDHGGDSQDMIIITLRGLEIYKISTKRNQCKLSRSISQGYSITANFWYEPNFRTILLAAPLYYPGDKETMNGTYANTATHLFKSLLGGYPSKVEQASVGMERMGDIVRIPHLFLSSLLAFSVIAFAVLTIIALTRTFFLCSAQPYTVLLLTVTSLSYGKRF